MNRFSLLLLLVACFCCQLPAQENDDLSFRDIVTESKEPNNDRVPDAFVVESGFEKIVIIRLKHGTDLLDGIGKAVKEYGIKNAVVLSGIGSLTSYHLHSVSNTVFPTENIFYKSSEPTDLLSVNGYVFDERIHVHVSVSNETTAIGGHLEPGSHVFTFAIITLGILKDGTDVSRLDDKTWR